MTAADRTLQRILRRESVRSLLAQPHFRDAIVVDAAGATLFGNADGKAEPSAEVRADGQMIGRVYGDAAPDLASALSAIADLGVESRALASESLDKYRELTMLYNVSEKILAAPDIGDVAALVCDEAQRFLRSDGISVLLLNEETGHLELAHSSGQPFHNRSSLELRDDLVGSVVRSGIGEIVNDVGADPRPVYADHPFRSVVCSPLKAGKRVFGIVVAGSVARRHYNAADLQLLSALASQAAAAIDVARLYRTLKGASPKPAELIYGLNDRPPPGALAVLGAQHVFIALIMLIVPVILAIEAGMTPSGTASLISMSLIAMGIATLFQVGRLGPIGSGYLAPQITSVIYLPPGVMAAQAGGPALLFGMTLLTGVFGLVLAQIIGRLRRFFPPELCGVVVLMIGLSVIRFAFPRFLGIEGTDASAAPAGLIVGLVTLATIVALTITSAGQVRLYATFIGLLVGYGAAFLFGFVDRAAIDRLAEQPLFGLPSLPTLDLAISPALVMPFLIATIVSNIKTVGLITSAQKTNDADWKRADMRSARGGIVADSIGNLSAGLLGGVGTAVSAGNVGLAAATGATARSIAVVAGLAFVALAFMPMVTTAVALMPAPVMGAGLLFISCFLVTSGLELILSRMLDARRTFVVGLSILAGIGLDVMPDAFAGAPAWTAPVFASPLALAAILAFGLNAVLNIGVAKKARLELTPDQPAHETVVRFFERRGAMWGARPDVIRRAGPAVVEWCEEIGQPGTRPALSIDVAFDEFHLTVDVNWRAETGEIDPSGLDRLIGHLQRRYDCQVRRLDRASRGHIRLDFEH